MTSEQRELIVNNLRENSVGKEVSTELLQMFQVGTVMEENIPTRDGETHIFIYYPEQPVRQPMPLLVNIHGGGFVKGHRQQDIVFCKNICANARCAVIDIDYTPAPEKQYPYALHQCYDTIKWAVTHSTQLNIDPARVVLAGHSAGGNFVAGITLMNNQNKDFNIALQILDYPPLDLYTPPQLKRDAYTNLRIPPEQADIYNKLYIDNDFRLLPTASPLFAPDQMLDGLPPALIIACGDDSLSEDAEKYAHRLIKAGVTIIAKRFMHSSHGFVVRRTDEFADAEKLIFDTLEKVFTN